MSGNDDDEALTWAGGRDPSHYETPEVRPPKPPKPTRSTTKPAAAASAAEAEAETEVDEELPPATSAVVLVALGVLGGIYLLYTIGWFVSRQRFLYASANELELIAFHVQQVLAIIGAPLWFTVTLLLTRQRKPQVRLVCLLIGALVLIPWPFVFGS